MKQARKFSTIASMLAVFTAASWGSAAYAQVELPQSTVDPDLVSARMAFPSPPLNVVTFRSFDRLFETEPVLESARPWLIPSDKKNLVFTYQYEGKSLGLDDFLSRTYTNAFIVVKDGRILTERYRNGGDASSRYAVFSIAKSLVSMLVGIAIDRGDIASINDPITRYAPEFIGTAYEGVTLRDALQMRSGVDFNEDGAPFFNFLETVIAGNQQRCADFIKSAPRKNAPGTTFNYSSPETCVIARVLEKATGQRLSKYMEQHLWQNAGMEHPGYWVLDGQPGIGTAIANGGFSASARDLARVGQLMLNGGIAGQRRILSADWVARSTATDGEESKVRREGYGYQWWTLGEPEAFVGVGLHGQYLYVVPSQKLVIVKFSYWPTGWDEKLEAETLAGFKAIGDTVSRDSETATPSAR
jgi:CubicO group peptidase (beta-lactamase class C family)